MICTTARSRAHRKAAVNINDGTIAGVGFYNLSVHASALSAKHHEEHNGVVVHIVGMFDMCVCTCVWRASCVYPFAMRAQHI